MRYIDPKPYCKRRIGENEFPQWETAVLCFRGIPGSFSLIDLLEAKPIKPTAFWGLGGYAGDMQAHETTVNGRNVVILPRCIWGATQAAILVEELTCYGCKNVIGYGLAGSINLSLDLLQHIVVESAVSTDGTSRIYGETCLTVSPELLALINDAAHQLGVDIRPVCGATVDALYRETPELMEEWRSLGADVINMEVSALYAAAQACGVNSIWLGFISDRLAETHEFPPSGKDEAVSVSAGLCKRVLELMGS